jgi:uncharacterized protein YbjT (DUF2867 family)
MPPMILVIGSRGFIGRHLVPRLVEAGWPVRVMIPPDSRDRARFPWPDDLVDVVEGSLYEESDLVQAMQDVHTVFHLASAQWWGTGRDLQQIDVDAARLVTQAALRARIGRLVVLSHLGAAPSSAYGLHRAKGQMETLVQTSGVPYTIVRCGLVFGEEDRFVNAVAMLLRTNPAIFLLPGQGETLLHPLYIDDLVQALVQSMENLDTVDRVLEIGGPEYLTFNELVRTVMRVSNARRSVMSMPPYALRFITRMLGGVFPRWPATVQWFDILASHRTASLNNMSDIFGIKPVRFEDTLLTYMPDRRYLPELVRFVFSRRPKRM